jgi:hypothetical protein
LRDRVGVYPLKIHLLQQDHDRAELGRRGSVKLPIDQPGGRESLSSGATPNALVC